MSTIALNKLLEYILSLSLSDKNKDWLAEKIKESKKSKKSEKSREEKLYSMYGAWANDESINEIEKSIHEGRVSGTTRKIIALDEV